MIKYLKKCIIYINELFSFLILLFIYFLFFVNAFKRNTGPLQNYARILTEKFSATEILKKFNFWI